MVSKPNDPTKSERAKRARRVMTLIEKVEILDKLKMGMSVAAVSRQNGVNESTIRTIRTCEEKIRASVRVSTRTSANVSKVCRRDPILETMESLLSAWIDEQKKHDEPTVDGATIREKAKQIYKQVVDQTGTTSRGGNFQASKGWFENFKKRFNPINAPPDEDCDSMLFEPDFLNIILHETAEEHHDKKLTEDQTKESSDSDLDAKNIMKCLRKVEKLKHIISETDPNADRSARINSDLDKAVLPYVKLLGCLKHNQNTETFS